MKQTYSALEVLAIAVAAYEINGRQVARDPVDNVLPNRQMIREYLEGNRKNLKIVSDHDRRHAEGIIEYLQQTGIMQTLIGKNDRFLQQINQLLSENRIGFRDLGILAWAPKVADDYQKKDAVKEVTARFSNSSQHIGRIGDKISINFTLIENHYVRSLECYSVFGRDEYDNFVRYWAKNKDKIIQQGPIRARVKNHERDPYHGNVLVTHLHYVKII